MVCLLDYDYDCGPASPLSIRAAVQPEGTIFFLSHHLCPNSPNFMYLQILSFQLLSLAGSKSLTQLRVVTWHVFPDL